MIVYFNTTVTFSPGLHFCHVLNPLKPSGCYMHRQIKH